MYKPKHSSQVKRIVARDGTRCHYCGVELLFEGDFNAPRFRSVDHIKPQARGGKSLLENLVLSCRICNSSKGVKSYEEFILKRQTDSMILWLMDGES